MRKRYRNGKLKSRRLFKRRGGRSRGVRKFKKLKTYRKYNVHSYKRAQGQPIYIDVFRTPVAGAWAAYSMDFKLSGIRNVGDFTAMYDKYQITGVKVSVRVSEFDNQSHTDSNTTASTSDYAIPQLWIMTDDDDISTPTVAEVRERTGARSAPITKPRSLFFKPKVAMEVYRGPTTTAYMPKSAPILDMAYSDVPHYGYKLVVEGPATGLTSKYCQLRLDVTYYFRCFNVT